MTEAMPFLQKAILLSYAPPGHYMLGVKEDSKKSRSEVRTVSKKFTAVRLLCAFGIAFVLTVAIIFGVSEEPVTAIYNLFLGPLQSKRHFFDVFCQQRTADLYGSGSGTGV